MKRITLLAATVLTLVGMSSLAHAKPSVAVLGLEVIDNGSVDKRATQAAQSLADELRTQANRPNGKFSLAPNSAKDLLELKLLSDCGDEGRSCMADIGKELKADRLLYGKLERRKNGYQVSLKLLNTNTKDMERTTSELIPEEDLHSDKKTRWSRSLYARLIGVPDSGTLRVDANVDRATIYIDGKVKTTLRDGSAKVDELVEGVRKVAIEADGHKRYEADVSITAGETESLSVSLIELASGGSGSGSESKPVAGWKYSFYAGAILTAGTGIGWAYYGQQAGYLDYLPGSSLIDEKNATWNVLKDREDKAIANTISADFSGSTGPSCENTNKVMGADRNDPDFKKFKSACDDGASAASRATYLGIGTGVLALATGYLGYRAYFSGASTTERRSATKKSKNSSRVVVMPHVSPESIGAGLSLEF